MKFEKSKDKPICPHCLTSLDKVLKRPGKGLSYDMIYFCPKCKKVLGISRSSI